MCERLPGRASLGSEDHGTGTCKPCGFFWKAVGCKHGQECMHCHACPAGELKARKKAKVDKLRVEETPALTNGTAAPVAPVPRAPPRASGSRSRSPRRRPVSTTALSLAEADAYELPPGVHSLPSPTGDSSESELDLASALPDARSWRYEPWNNKVIAIRRAPSLDSEFTDHVLHPNEAFKVQEERPGPDGILFLHLADGRGWVFDKKPEGVMCVRDRKPQISVGSVLHGTGDCKPCGFFWKAAGCLRGADCQHCHLCPEGELKARRKVKTMQLRNA